MKYLLAGAIVLLLCACGSDNDRFRLVVYGTGARQFAILDTQRGHVQFYTMPPAPFEKPAPKRGMEL